MSSEIRAKLRAKLVPNALFEGKYRVLKPIGTGNFAYVVHARHEAMGRDVALKILKPEIHEQNPELSERFMTEVKAVSQLRHPNTVTIYDFGITEDNIQYMVLEFVPGRTLDDVLKTGPFTKERAIHVTFQIMKSLNEAHARGIIHRDLKPSNIMLADVAGELDFVKILDFGVAKFVDDGTQQKPKTQAQRRSTRFIGTPIYMSPEQVLGQPVDASSDIYSMGLILYEMLTGEPPIEGNNVAAIAQLHLNEAPLPFKRMNSVPREIAKLILTATRRHPSDRIPSAKRFSSMLGRAMNVDVSVELRTSDMMVAVDRKSVPARKRESTSEFFLKRTGLPETQTPQFEAGKKTTKRKKKVATQPAKVRKEKPLLNPTTSPTLEVDFERARRTDLSRRPVQKARVSTSIDPVALVMGATLFLIGSFVSFVIASGLVPQTDGLARFFVGLIPIAAACAGTSFAIVRHRKGSIVERWVLPTGRNVAVIAVILVLMSVILMPNHASSSLSESPNWFAGDSGPVYSATRIVTVPVVKLCSLTSEFIPW